MQAQQAPGYDHLMGLYLNEVALRQKREDERDRVMEMGRDLAESANRVRCCMGDKMLRLCNQIEGIEDDE